VVLSKRRATDGERLIFGTGGTRTSVGTSGTC
jgi:hypothetical protein